MSELLIERDGEVALFTLNRPEVHKPGQADDRGHQRLVPGRRCGGRLLVRLPHRRRERAARAAQQALGPLARRRRHAAAAAGRGDRQRP